MCEAFAICTLSVFFRSWNVVTAITSERQPKTFWHARDLRRPSDVGCYRSEDIKHLFLQFSMYWPTGGDNTELHTLMDGRMYNSVSWWRHQMETFSVLLAICAGNSLVTGEFRAHKGQWREALMFSLIWVWINGWVNSHEAGYLRRHRAHYDVTVMENVFCLIYETCSRFWCVLFGVRLYQ